MDNRAYHLQGQSHSAVSSAIQSGKLQRKPCEICDQSAQAHHDSYYPDKWLSVRWLCAAHHRQWHENNEPEWPTIFEFHPSDNPNRKNPGRRGKHPGLWWHRARKLWYVTLDGRQHNLGPDLAEANRRFFVLLAEYHARHPARHPALQTKETVQNHGIGGSYGIPQIQSMKELRENTHLYLDAVEHGVYNENTADNEGLSAPSARHVHLNPTGTMAKPSDLWFRKQTGFWMTTINGKQHKLSKDKGEARRMLHKLLASDKPQPGHSGISTRKLCDSYLVRKQESMEKESHAVRITHLKPFVEKFGHRDPASIKVHEVEEWLDARDTWAGSTKALFITIIKAVFNWSVEQGYLDENPIRKLKRRSTGRRRRMLTPEEKEKIKAAASEGLRDFLMVLEGTGCRPFSEAARLTAADIDFEKGRAILEKHKNAKKGKVRTLYFPPHVLSRLKELAERYPEGVLLRNRLGLPWSKNNTSKYIARICKRLGIEGVTSYTIRHAFISTALVKGVPIDVIAQLAGNSPDVIRKNYSQLDLMDEALRAAAQRAIT